LIDKQKYMEFMLRKEYDKYVDGIETIKQANQNTDWLKEPREWLDWLSDFYL